VAQAAAAGLEVRTETDGEVRPFELPTEAGHHRKKVERGERDGSLIGASDRSAFSLWRTRLRGQPRSVLFIAASSPPLAGPT
jgi:hypothetical protein